LSVDNQSQLQYVSTMTQSVAPIKRESIATLVAEQIRSGIIDGTFAPGTQMGEVQLAERFDVSRGPVREAMARLVQEGLLVSEPRRGVFVLELATEDMPDIFLAREAIETTAAVRVCRTAPASLFTGLERLLDRMAGAARRGRWSELSEIDLQFHQAIVDAAGSVRLARMFRTLAAEMLLCLNALERAYPRPTDVVDEHRELLEALRTGDERRVVEAFTHHLAQAGENLTASP